jgi:hypothetical protein
MPALQTPYLPLWRLEAAICPGPIKAGVPTVPGVEEPKFGKGGEGGEEATEATRKSKRNREDEPEVCVTCKQQTPVGVLPKRNI